MKRLLPAVLLAALIALPAAANDLRIENVQFVAPRDTGGPMRALFDVSWDNAWHNDRNHDAAWVFIKSGPDAGLRHVQVAASGHRVVEIPGAVRLPAGIEVPEDRMGLFVHVDAPHRGAVRFRLSVELADLPEEARNQSIEVFGIEMVYIPEGAFDVGDPDPTARQFGAMFSAGTDGTPAGSYRVGSEGPIRVGDGAGSLGYPTGQYLGDGEGPIPDAFPKGYRAFYTMKYELSQGQYAAFLNGINEEATFQRANFYGRPYYGKRGTIRLEHGRYVAGEPDRPMNHVSWDDGLAFADWTGLRPMTELEYTKAARGQGPVVPGAFPWGTADRDAVARVVGPTDDVEMANGWGEDRLSDETLAVFGASYYWVMDLAGSVWERVITVGWPDGRAFEGTHGDGRLGGGATATNEDWPHLYDGKEGFGYRGGGFYDQGRSATEFNPYSPVAYRRFGAWSGGDPYRAYGFRAVRTAP